MTNYFNGGIIGTVNNPTSTTVVTTFTAGGSYVQPNMAPTDVDYLVVAGGGGSGNYYGAGGGGGGF
jgi:hypothetical protein